MTPQDTPPPLDLEAIKSRAAAATPGPWIVCVGSGGCECTGIHSDAAPGVICDFLTDYMLKEYPNKVILHDLKFVEAARADIPALIAEIERLRGVDQGNGVREAAKNLAWAAEVEIQGGHRTRAFIQQHRSKVTYWIKEVRAALAATASPSEAKQSKAPTPNPKAKDE